MSNRRTTSPPLTLPSFEPESHDVPLQWKPVKSQAKFEVFNMGGGLPSDGVSTCMHNMSMLWVVFLKANKALTWNYISEQLYILSRVVRMSSEITLCFITFHEVFSSEMSSLREDVFLKAQRLSCPYCKSFVLHLIWQMFQVFVQIKYLCDSVTSLTALPQIEHYKNKMPWEALIWQRL